MCIINCNNTKRLYVPEWTIACLLKVMAEMNSLSHKSHLNGLMPVWRPVWDWSSTWVRNVLSQSSHLNGLSPVWTACKANECCITFYSTETFGVKRRMFDSSVVYTDSFVSSRIPSLQRSVYTKWLECEKTAISFNTMPLINFRLSVSMNRCTPPGSSDEP